jgi:hypothetical protein
MPLFNKKQKSPYTLDNLMYMLQNDLIDVLKVKKAYQGKLEVEKILSKMLDIKPKFSQEEINTFSSMTEQVIQNINLSETEDVSNHVEFILDFATSLITKKDVKALKENYLSKQRKYQNESKINKEIVILNGLIEEQRSDKDKIESQLQSIKEYAFKNQDKLKNNPTELRNVRRAIERAEISKNKADQQIGVLNTALYGKQTELNILNQAEEASVIDTVGKVDVSRLTSIKAQTQDKLEKIVQDGDFLDELDKLNQDQLIKTNSQEDTEFLNEWLSSQPKEVDKEKKEEEKEERFEDFLKSLN